MRIYLAASYSRKEEIKGIAQELRGLGLDVQSRWLFEPDIKSSSLEEKLTKQEFLRSRAEIDEEDVRNCEVLVRFTDDLSKQLVPSHLATGSRFFEMALARETGATVIVVGGHQCVFDYLPDIVHVKDVLELKKLLKGDI